MNRNQFMNFILHFSKNIQLFNIFICKCFKIFPENLQCVYIFNIFQETITGLAGLTITNIMNLRIRSKIIIIWLFFIFIFYPSSDIEKSVQTVVVKSKFKKKY